MVQIVLIRPGSTEYDEQGRIQGTLDIPLSAQGYREAERLASEVAGLGISQLYSSECLSATQTAKTIADALRVKLKKLDQMQNLNQGLWQGMMVEDVRQKQPTVYRQWQEQPEIICPPEGEMVAEAEERVRTTLKKLLKKHNGATIGLVIPEPLASVVESQLRQTPLGDLWKADLSSGVWSVVDVASDCAMLVHRGLPIQEAGPPTTTRMMSNGQK